MLRARRGTWIGLLGALGVAAGLVWAVYAAVVPTGQTFPVGSKVTPFALSVFSSASLPPEVQAQEAATAPLLFDRDTTTQHVVFAESSVQAAFESAQEVRAIKVFGAAPYSLSVKADSGGSFQTIAGLENLDLTLLPAGWSTFNATAPVTTGKLLFTLTPATGGTASGLGELEVWTTAAPVSVKNGAALLAQLLGPTPPPQGRFYTALNSSADPTTAVVTPNDSSKTLATNTFSFTLDRDPAHLVRAYLTYELYGQASFISVERIINGSQVNSSLQGGMAILPTSAWSTQVERVNPAWLIRGTNTIEFKVLSSSYTNGGFTVRNVRVVGELDNGANAIETTTVNQPDALGSNPIEALYDGDLATGWRPYPTDQPIEAVAPSVEFTLRRPTQMDAVSLYLSGPLSGQVQLSVKQAGVWSDFPAEAASGFDTGWNTIYVPATVPLDQRAYEGVKLTFTGGSGSSAEIREFLFVGSGVGGRTVPPKIFIAYPDAGQFYGRLGYVQGFVEPWNNGSGNATITLGGQTLVQVAAAISGVRNKNNVGFASQADSDAWSYEVKATYPDGETVSTLVSFTQQMSPASPASGPLAGSVSATVSNKAKKTLSNDESTLVFDAGTVAADTTVTITPLADQDVPALDVGMVNVTKGPRRGYRFLPHGAKFLKNVAVALPYDRALIPPGHTEDDVKSFYFDDQAGRWIELPRVSVDKSNKVINSTTDHFTDMINATVTVPDHPQTVSFNPTSMKDIKAADPGAQVNLIEPPKANNMGDARLSYPIEVPPGRQGIQPQFAVTYNSSGGNGWMGMGWDLAQRAITIDTRFGVPRYDTGQIDGTPRETETYMLEGEMLTPVAHRGALQPRTPEKIFQARVEGQFRKIIRHGISPSTYWWEVIDKNGVRSIYGGALATQTQDSSAVLRTDGGQVFRWALTEMRDLNGNRMTYTYDTVSDVGLAAGLVAGRQLYLKQCVYTGDATGPGRYTVTFYRDHQLPGYVRRPDVQIDARGGFKQVTANLLKRIEVKFDNRPVRSYQFEYREGAFGKTLLKLVSQFGADGALFNIHTFDYFDDITAGQTFAGFLPSTDWNTQDDGLNSNFLGTTVGPSALGGTEGIGGGASLSIGFAPFPTKYLSFNGMVGAGINKSKGKLSLVDIDGDGLPDKVFLDGGTIKFRRNTVNPRSDPLAPITFESSARIAQDMGVLSEDETLSFNFGGQAYVFGVNLIGDVGHSLTTQRSYISDVNGDGLPDVVKGGQVWFNRWRNKAAGDFTPVFTASSAGSEFPIAAGAVNASGMLPEKDFQAIEQELLEQNPLMDAVRRWTAPFSGRVAVDGDVRLVDVLNDPLATAEEKQRRQAYQTADGVRVAIERPGLPDPLWRQDIAATDFTAFTPTNTTSIPVNKGDAIYFRVQSQFDGAYDEVSWAPRVRYLDTTEGGTVPTGVTDVNRLDPYVFQAEREFVYAGRVNTMDTPFKGKVRVTGTLDKAVTTDDVRIAIYRFSETEFQQQFTHRRDYTLVHQQRAPVARYSMRWDETGPLSFDGTPDIDVEARDKLLVLVEVDSNIDLTKLQWRAANPLKLFYTEAFRTTDQPSETAGGAPLKDADGNPIGWTPGEPIKVTDDAGNFLIQLTQQHEINFYPDNALNRAQGDFLAGQTGWLMVNPQVTPKPVLVPGDAGLPVEKPFFDHDSEMALTVKQRGELAGKRVVPLAAGKAYVPQQQSFAVPVYKGDRLFFDLSTRDPELYPTLESTGVSVHYIRPQSVVTLNDIPLNQPGDGTAWPGAAGTLTVLPLLGATPGAPIVSGEVVLSVLQEHTAADGSTARDVVVERRMDFNTQTPFNPYAHAFDLPPDAAGSTFFFRYSTTNPDLAAALTVHAVTIAIQTDYSATQQEFSGLTLFVQPPDVPNGDAGKALLSVGASAATVAIAPVIKQGSALVSTVTGDATLTVVRRFVVTDPQNPNAPPQTQEVVVATQAISLTAGKRFNPGEHVFDVAAQANDTLVIYFSTQDSAPAALGLDWGLWTQTRRHVGGNAPTETPPSMLHRYGSWDLFANPYRGWAYVGYNSEGMFNGVPLKDQPIVPARLTISSNDADYRVPDDPDQAKSKRVKDLTAFPASPQQEQNRWFAGDEMWRVKADRIASSRMGLDFVRLPRGADYASSVPADPGGAGATAVPRISIVKGEVTVGIGFLVNINHTTTPGQGLLDFMDMNGDRFPDVVGGNTVQYTEMVGGLGGRRGSTDTPFVRDSVSVADNIAPGGTVQKAVADAKGLFNGKIPGAEAPNRNSSFGLTGSLGKRDSDVKAEYIDMNGDGLPDRVFDDGGTIRVALNLGYGFAAPEPWGAAVVDDSETKYVNAGISYNDGVKGWAGSLAITRSLGKTRKKLVDINGDGLPDRVTEVGGTLFVGINTGNGFADDRPWTGVSTTLSNNQSISLNGGASLNFDIGPLCIAACYINLNPAVSLSTTVARSETTLQDVNGDGYPDRIASTEEGKMSVALNRTGRTNLLKTFSRPLGARVDIEYVRDGNTHDQPQSRWVLSKTTVFDGVVGNGPDTQVTTYKYEGGFYHRLEREFYGYRKVTEEHRNTAAGEVLYRFMAREYLNDSYYAKGLLKRELLQDAAGAPFNETENTYQLRDVTTGLVPANPLSTVGTIFPEQIRTDRRFYEGQVSPGKTSFTTHEYDALGNIVRFTDDGEPGVATDNVDATIAYTSCEPTSYVIKPKHIEVRGSGTLMRLRDADIECATGNLTQVRQTLADGSTAITDLAYFANGNLLKVTGPANKTLQRYALTYTYDPDVATHVASITDSFNLSSSATHNLLFGKVETTVDTNGNQTTNIYDAVGRLEHIVGPYEQGPGQSVATLAFEYHPEGCTLGQGGCTISVPYAITRHVDKDADGNYKNTGTIDTILFTDGLKRVLQTKKDATVLEGNASAGQEKMIVSGQVTFDAFGRTVAQRYPTTEVKASDVENGAFNPVADAVAPTTMDYDVLDRNTRTVIPDASTTSIEYRFGVGRSSPDMQFETIVTDANVNQGLRGAVKHTFRDVRELITSVKERTAAGDLWTSYGYDALKQITQVLDDKLNTTNISYDNFGRRTVIDNPDTGRTETQYDLASNVTAKITANLKSQSRQITYAYDFNRLTAITYPNFPGNNVTYEYGTPALATDANGNRAGRITKITSQMGTEERQYGRLGETVYEKKTVTTFTDPLHPSVFETRFLFETFGRLLRITYPDGEVVTNTYDSGGNLASAKGVKRVDSQGQNHTYTYLQSLLYDKFEQRALVTQGNGVKTTYTYDAANRRLNNLTAVRQSNTIFQNLSYSYDKVGNILGLKNAVDLPHANEYGGPSVQRFEYDDLYRLTKAQGVFPANVNAPAPDSTACASIENSHCRVYALDLTYDTIHNITRKNQADTRYPPGNTAGVVQKKTTYDFAYAYNASGSASVRPHAPNHIGVRAYTYDLDGNQTGWTHDQNGTRRTIVWDDENRIQEVSDQGHVKTYKYDDQGNRMIKRGPQGETVYVNQFYTQRPGATGTKHVYAGTSRIASKLVRQDTPNSNPSGNTPFEKDLYFYHPDHIGSSNYVTDLNGKLYEHLEYFPFGEGWIEENSNVQRTPYLFTAKELDEETGLYYFGARYYDPRTSVWQSADPILAKYLPTGNKDQDQHLPGIGGVFNPLNLAVFTYAGANPVKYLDPDGKELIIQGSTTYKTQVLAIIQKLTDDKLAFAKDGSTVIIASSGKGTKSTGSALVRGVVEHEKKTTILHKAGKTAEEILPRTAAGFAAGVAKGEPSPGGLVGTGLGGNTEIGFDLSVTRSIKGSAVPKEIVLGHELVHSYHDVRGTTAGIQPGGVPGWEQQAVGLGKYQSGINENSLRKEQGLQPRTEY